MGSKTIYVKEKDGDVLKELEELSGESCSALFSRLAEAELVRLKNAKRAKAGKVSKLLVRYKDENDVERKVAFSGRWIAKNFTTPQRKNITYSVAITENERLFVLIENENEGTSTYVVHETFVDMAAAEIWKTGQYPSELLANVAREIGEDFVEELDI